MQQKFDSLNTDYNTLLEQNRQNEQSQFDAKTQHNEELKQLRANFEQEKLDSTDKEKLIEELREKLRCEQNQTEKMQQEFKSIHSKYDTLQVEVLQLREAKASELVILESAHPPPSTTTRLMRSKRSANDEVRHLRSFV